MNASTEKSTAGRDPADLEREASQIRADMDRTLDALERKFSPGQLLDRSLNYLREHGGDVTRNAGDIIRRNPVPVLMTVAGITWLVASSVRAGSAVQDDTFGDESPYADDVAGESRSQGLHDRVAATRDRIRSSRQAAANKLSEVADATRAQTRRAQDRIHSMMDEQPLMWGGLAVALGALIGAVIPSTQYENRTVGQVRDRAVQRAKQMGERQYENLRGKLEPQRDIEVSGPAH